MTNSNPDPASAAWASFSPPSNQRPVTYSVPHDVSVRPRWRWTWYAGIMYGNVPVGIITVVTLKLIAMAAA